MKLAPMTTKTAPTTVTIVNPTTMRHHKAESLGKSTVRSSALWEYGLAGREGYLETGVCEGMINNKLSEHKNVSF